MGRKKKINNNIDFDAIFGNFQSDVEQDNSPMSTMVVASADKARPCKECGRYPRIHIANFKNKTAHPNNVYISCACGECDGNWYPDIETALAAWNAANEGAVARPDGKKDEYDFTAEIVRDMRIPD